MEGPGGSYHRTTPEESAQFWLGFILGATLCALAVLLIVVGTK